MQYSDRTGSKSGSWYSSAQHKRLTTLWTKAAYPKSKEQISEKLTGKLEQKTNKTTMVLLTNIVKEDEGQLENINFCILVIYIFNFFFNW